MDIKDPDFAAASSLKATVAGGAATFLGGLTANDLAIYGGLLLGVAGFLLQLYFQHRRDRREQAAAEDKHREHLARMRAIEEGKDESNDNQ